MTRKGVWNLQQVRDKYLQSLWAQTHSLFAWGNGVDGQGMTGLNNRTEYNSPVQVGTDGNWRASGTGNNETYNVTGTYTQYSIKEDGTLWAWGNNTQGGLGQNNITQYSSPVQIGSDATWANVSGGNAYATATKTDGTLWAWGRNSYGALGTNQPDGTRYSSPVQVGSSTDWSSTSTSGSAESVMARKTDGTMWSWGYNTYGMLGDNSTVNKSSPTQLPGTNWSEQYTYAQLTTYAIKTDGTLWVWGRNYEGQLGLNQSTENNTRYSSPVQLGSGTDWALVAKGGLPNARNPLAVKTNGTLWAWGRNDYGALGQNNTTQYSSPVQVPGTWSTTIRPAASNGGAQAMAIKSDNTLWSWGWNDKGQLGVGDRTHRSSPTQIPGTKWSDVMSSGTISSAVQSALTPSQL